jgi:hypothetical protein
MSGQPRIAVQIETISKEINPVLYLKKNKKGKDKLELYELNSDFFLTTNHRKIQEQLMLQKVIGEIEYRNKKLSAEEFDEHISNHEYYRNKLLNTVENTNSAKTKDWARKILNFFKQ